MPERAKRASVVEIKTYQETSDCEASTILTKTNIYTRTYLVSVFYTDTYDLLRLREQSEPRQSKQKTSRTPVFAQANTTLTKTRIYTRTYLVSVFYTDTYDLLRLRSNANSALTIVRASSA